MDYNVSNKNINFGMALYKPSNEKLIKALGSRAVKAIDESSDYLKEMAKDCDIYIIPNKAKSNELRSASFTIGVYDLEKNPIKRLFKNRNLHVSQRVDTYPNVTLKAKIMETAERLVRDFKEYR